VATDYLWLGATLVMVIMVASIFLYLPTSPVVLTEIPHEIHVFFYFFFQAGQGAKVMAPASWSRSPVTLAFSGLMLW